MNILYITRHYPPEISGGARRPYLYVKALRELGNKVTVVTPFELDDPNSITVYDAALSNNKYTAVKESNNFLIRFYNFIKVKIVTWSRWPDPNIKWVNKVIKKVDLDGGLEHWLSYEIVSEPNQMVTMKYNAILRESENIFLYFLHFKKNNIFLYCHASISGE
jgi:hypothetical protein